MVEDDDVFGAGCSNLTVFLDLSGCSSFAVSLILFLPTCMSLFSQCLETKASWLHTKTHHQCQNVWREKPPSLKKTRTARHVIPVQTVLKSSFLAPLRAAWHSSLSVSSFEEHLSKLDRLNRVSQILGHLHHLPGWAHGQPVQPYAPRCAPGRHSAPRVCLSFCSRRVVSRPRHIRPHVNPQSATHS